MRFPLWVICATLLLAADSFTGKWSSGRSGSGGTIRITAEPDPSVSFTLNDSEVKTRVVSWKLENDSIEAAYEFMLDGYKLRSTLKGARKDGKLSGTYQTKSLEDGSSVDSGTFDVTVTK